MDERMAGGGGSSSSSPSRHIDPNDPYGFLFLEIGSVSDDQMELLSRARILNEVVVPPLPPAAAAAAEPPPPPPPSPPPETVPPLTPISHEPPLPSIIVAAPAPAPAPATSTESPPHSTPPAIVAATATDVEEPTPSMPPSKKKKKNAASVPATASNPGPRPVVWFRDLLPPLPQGLSIDETVNVLWRERFPERDPEAEPKSLVQVAKLKGFWWHGDGDAGSPFGANSRR